MSVVVDTGALVADQNPRDVLHDEARAALAAALRGAWGAVVITDYIVDEAITLCRVRTGRHELADGLAARLLGEAPHRQAFALVRVGYVDFLEARRLFSKYRDQALSFTDCTTLAVMRSRGIERVLSFDEDFDRLVQRVPAPG